MFRIALPFAVVIAAAFAAPAGARTFDSLYSRLDFQKCAEASSPEPGVIEVHVCEDAMPARVTWTGEPDSSDVAFGRAPLDEAIDLGDFHEPRGTVEWRTRTRNGQTAPIAAIVRYDVGNNIGSLDRSVLVVYRLESSGGSCVMGLVDGARPNANGEARQLADRYAGGFVCGESRRHGG